MASTIISDKLKNEIITGKDTLGRYVNPLDLYNSIKSEGIISDKTYKSNTPGMNMGVSISSLSDKYNTLSSDIKAGILKTISSPEIQNTFTQKAPNYQDPNMKVNTFFMTPEEKKYIDNNIIKTHTYSSYEGGGTSTDVNPLIAVAVATGEAGEGAKKEYYGTDQTKYVSPIQRASNLNEVVSAAPVDSISSYADSLYNSAISGLTAQELAEKAQEDIANTANKGDVTYTPTTTTTTPDTTTTTNPSPTTTTPTTTNTETTTTPSTTTDASTITVASKDPNTVKTWVDNIINDMGYTLSDQGKKELQNYFISVAQDENMPALTEYQIRNIIGGESGYQQQQTTKARETASTELAKQGQQFLTKNALPQVEKAYARLGGTNRASAASALGYAAQDIAQQRENTLANIQTSDSLQDTINKYNASVNASNQLTTQALANKQFGEQKYWNTQQQNAIRTQNIITDKRRAEDWTQAAALAEKQRQWTLQDQQTLADQQKSQNWWNLAGTALGTVAGAFTYNKFLKG